MMKLKILVILFFSFLLVSCSSKQSKNIDKTRKDEVKIEKLLNSIKFSASPRLSIRYCKEILEIDSKNAEAYYRLGESYKDMKNIVVSTEAEKKYYDSLSIEAFKKANELGCKKEVE